MQVKVDTPNTVRKLQFDKVDDSPGKLVIVTDDSASETHKNYRDSKSTNNKEQDQVVWLRQTEYELKVKQENKLKESSKVSPIEEMKSNSKIINKDNDLAKTLTEEKFNI